MEAFEKLEQLRDALILGEESELVESFDPVAHLKLLHERKLKDSTEPAHKSKPESPRPS